MRFTLVPFLVVLVLCFFGCENPTATNAARLANSRAEASGSPFRWMTQSVNGGTAMFLVLIDFPSGPTAADALLKKDTLALLAKAEASQGRMDPEVEDIKHLSNGREVWILKSKQEGIAYIVRFVLSPQGGTDIQMSGPTKYQKQNL